MTKEEYEILRKELLDTGVTIKELIISKGLPIHRFYYYDRKYNQLDQGLEEKRFMRIGEISKRNDKESSVRIEYLGEIRITLDDRSPNELRLNLSKFL